MADLLIGCGKSRIKRLAINGNMEWNGLVTLDVHSSHNPDIVHDLNNLPLPFDDNSFDSIHAYDVLEHIGKQGDWKGFFAEWSEYWRILKPDGLFFGITPAAFSKWAWGDPGHTRIISLETLCFLCQEEYIRQIGITPMTDYRNVYSADFDVGYENTSNDAFSFILKAIKPSRFPKDLTYY
jgi:SAM-dependent methyltransferase